MRRPVLPNADAVMGENIDDGLFHERGEAHGWAHVIAKDQKCRPIWPQTAVNTHAVQDGPHGVFANAKVEIAAGFHFAEYAAAFQYGVIAGAQIRAAPC